jgi:hypothetical protein
MNNKTIKIEKNYPVLLFMKKETKVSCLLKSKSLIYKGVEFYFTVAKKKR